MSEPTEEEKEAEWRRRRFRERRNEMLPIMASLIAAGMGEKALRSPGSVANDAVTVALAIYDKVQSLP